MKRWTKDIGSRVSKGEVLAEIETPEIDQQLSQAIAARNQTASSLDLAKSTAERWEALRKKDAVSQQELDERRSNSAQAAANLAAADFVAVASLVLYGMFVVTQTDPLRLYVNVPQTYAQLVKAGQVVTVTQAELRGQKFQGQVARTAASIDAASRSMQVEISLPNGSGTLLPGAFVQVALPLAASSRLAIANNALMIRGDGIKVAVVDPQGKVTLRSIQVGRNYGINVEVVDGLKGGERLVLNPSDSLTDGDVVSFSTTADVPKEAASGAGKPGELAKAEAGKAAP